MAGVVVPVVDPAADRPGGAVQPPPAPPRWRRSGCRGGPPSVRPARTRRPDLHGRAAPLPRRLQIPGPHRHRLPRTYQGEHGGAVVLVPRPLPPRARPRGRPRPTRQPRGRWPLGEVDDGVRARRDRGRVAPDPGADGAPGEGVGGPAVVVGVAMGEDTARPKPRTRSRRNQGTTSRAYGDPPDQAAPVSTSSGRAIREGEDRRIALTDIGLRDPRRPAVARSGPVAERQPRRPRRRPPPPAATTAAAANARRSPRPGGCRPRTGASTRPTSRAARPGRPEGRSQRRTPPPPATARAASPAPPPPAPPTARARGPARRPPSTPRRRRPAPRPGSPAAPRGGSSRTWRRSQGSVAQLAPRLTSSGPGDRPHAAPGARQPVGQAQRADDPARRQVAQPHARIAQAIGCQTTAAQSSRPSDRRASCAGRRDVRDGQQPSPRRGARSPPDRSARRTPAAASPSQRQPRSGPPRVDAAAAAPSPHQTHVQPGDREEVRETETGERIAQSRPLGSRSAQQDRARAARPRAAAAGRPAVPGSPTARRTRTRPAPASRPPPPTRRRASTPPARPCQTSPRARERNRAEKPPNIAGPAGAAARGRPVTTCQRREVDRRP